MPPEMTSMSDTKKFGQYFDPDSTLQKMDQMVKENGRDYYKVPTDPETQESMDPAKVAAILQRAELGNKRLDVLLSKMDTMPPDQGLGAKDAQTLARILTDVKSSRPNDQEKQVIDNIVNTINEKGANGLTSQETCQIYDQMNSIRHDKSFFSPEQVKSLANTIDNKISELQAQGKDTSSLDQQKKIMNEISKLNDVGKEVTEHESSGMSEKETQRISQELKEALSSDDDEDKKDKKDQRDDKDESSEESDEMEEPSNELESMTEEGGESMLEDGVEEGLGDSVVEGAGDVAVEGAGEAAPEVVSGVVESAGGLVGAEGAALPEEVSAAAGLEAVALPEEVEGAAVVVGAVGAAEL